MVQIQIWKLGFEQSDIFIFGSVKYLYRIITNFTHSQLNNERDRLDYQGSNAKSVMVCIIFQVDRMICEVSTEFVS